MPHAPPRPPGPANAEATILSVGRRTVCNLLRTLDASAPGHPARYHRVFSKRRWSCWRLARGLCGWVFDPLASEDKVLLAGDDTVDGPKDEKVFGKVCHRDPVRSTHSYTTYRWGHQGVVLSVLVRLPFTKRQGALPLLVARGKSEEGNEKAGKRHKTPQHVLRQLCCVRLRWFPRRRFTLAGDGGYNAHETARFPAGRRGRLHRVSTFYPDARL